MTRSLAYALLALALALFGLAMCAQDVFAVDCHRLPQVCAEQAAKPVVTRRAKIVRKIKSFRRKAVQVRRGSSTTLSAPPKSTRESEPTAHLAQLPAETLMYRQIVPVLVSTTAEPRIIPLPSRMPDISARSVYRIEAPQILAAPAGGWSRSKEGKIAIGLLVLAFAIGSVAYALDQKPKGKRHAAAHQNRATIFRTACVAITDQLGRLGARSFGRTPQSTRIEPHFA